MKSYKPKVLLLLIALFVAHFNYAQDSIPLSLSTAIDMALSKNIDITMADYQVNTLEYAMKEVNGSFLPKLFVNANYNRNINQPVIFLPEGFGMGGPTKLGSNNDYRAALNLAQPIYSHFNINNKKLMENRFSYQNEIRRETRQKVVNATKKSYFNYLIAQEIVKVQKTQLENAEQTLLDIEKRRRLGTLTDYDYTAAKAQFTQAKSSLLEAQSTIMPLANSLKLMLGLKMGDNLKLTKPVELLQNELVLEVNPTKVLTENSTLRQLELDIEVKENQITLAKSAFFPTLDAVGVYNYQAQADDFRLSEYQWVNTSYVGLQLQVSIFNGNITKNKIQQAKIAKYISEDQREYTTEALQMQHQELLSHLDFSKQKIEVQLENMELTEEALRLANKRYELVVFL